MRKCLNILQATHLGCGEVNEENVYFCTGNPLPGDIKCILDSLLNKGFKEVFHGRFLCWDFGPHCSLLIRFEELLDLSFGFYLNCRFIYS